jgi:hypothetical protein
MFHFGNGALTWALAVVAAAAVAFAVVWLAFGGSSSSEQARDYEDCVERLQAQGVAGEELNTLLTGCGARFAGRRKTEGSGYTYYDFMQDKKYDIAGPNPTVDERKAIDREYIGYLETQRREAMSEAIARQQNEKLRADIEGAHQPPAGQPLSLMPTANVPLPVPRRVAEQREKARQCAEDKLLCTLSKLSTAVKDAFASSPRTKN